MTKAEQLEQAVKTCREIHYVNDLALGYLRYEAVRKLSLSAITVLHMRSLSGEHFDDMVDSLILDGLTTDRDQAD